jgi:hypothetical protein
LKKTHLTTFVHIKNRKTHNKARASSSQTGRVRSGIERFHLKAKLGNPKRYPNYPNQISGDLEDQSPKSLFWMMHLDVQSGKNTLIFWIHALGHPNHTFHLLDSDLDERGEGFG